ncbi:MAG: cation:proton antiporter [Muribaculaceae bacterium]|nr:cation:proton antiporter [Muribaculaceae bacterium]
MEALNMNSLIGDLALILVLGAVATVVFKLLKQPVVLGYIVAGFLASPHFSFFPTVATHENIEFWAQIGIIVLLFSLGLEFSFKKLLNVGSSAIITCLIIVTGMLGLGFVVGKMLHFSTVNAIFLGGMISMSSTTIIIKALTDLNMRQRRFVPLVLAVLIIEDLVAVVLMVILSSIAIHKTVESGEMLKSILKLSFFLVMWFTVGIFLIPTVFKRFRRIISDELMLVIAMGLCFLMAILAVKAGFSLALGAFVMGSILAGTSEAERIERIIMPVKDLFGAVFFISVGMMVNPQVIVDFWPTIALLSVVVVVGMILFGTFGMLAAGQPLKIAMESGFCLTQIGEFSFIIATLGMALGVLDSSMYPIIVTVSVVTTFFTPFFIKRAIPCYNWVAKHLPQNWSILLEGYSKNAAESEQKQSRSIWKSVIKRYILRTLLYSVVTVTLIFLCRTYLIPFITGAISGALGRFLAMTSTIAIISPFVYAIIFPSVTAHEREQLVQRSGRVSYVPLVVMSLFSLFIATNFIVGILYGTYSLAVSIIASIGIILLLVLVLSPLYKRRLKELERRFVSNVNERENRRTGKGHNLVSDLHLAYMRVGYSCPFVGERLRNADLRRKYGVNVASIQRGLAIYPVPKGDMRIFPGDVLGVVGTDEQIQVMLPLVESNEKLVSTAGSPQFLHFAITEESPIVGKTLSQARLREEYRCMLVAVQRGDDDEYLNPPPDLCFAPGDILWIVGDPKLLEPLRK